MNRELDKINFPPSLVWTLEQGPHLLFGDWLASQGLDNILVAYNDNLVLDPQELSKSNPN